MVMKLYHPYTQFPRNVCLRHRSMVIFLIIVPYMYIYYEIVHKVHNKKKMKQVRQ